MSEVVQQSGDGNNNSDIMASPNKQKLNSMVLGDGSFESMMKERSKVSTDYCYIGILYICILFLCYVAIHTDLWGVYPSIFSIVYLNQSVHFQYFQCIYNKNI